MEKNLIVTLNKQHVIELTVSDHNKNTIQIGEAYSTNVMIIAGLLKIVDLALKWMY